MAVRQSKEDINIIGEFNVLDKYSGNKNLINATNLEKIVDGMEFNNEENELHKNQLGAKQISDANIIFLRAVRSGDFKKIIEIIETAQVTDLNISNANGLNALHLAARDGFTDILEELLKRGANVDCATKKGNTALHIASLAGQKDIVKLLIQYNANVNVQSLNGFTPLYMAAQENHDSCVKYLLAKGANPLLATDDGFTPLAVAMQQGHDKVVAVLLLTDSRGKVRLPALHIAAKKDDIKTAAFLLENNEYNPADVTSKSGFTPLHIAAHYGNSGIAQLLIEKGANVNYTAKHNITPLHVACKWGKIAIIELLIANNADIYAQTRDGLTPLHCAARSGHSEVIEILLRHSAAVAPSSSSNKNLIQSATKNGLVPLHMAAQGEHDAAALILLKHGACVDDITVDYLTTLHVAAHCGHVKVAQLLLYHQANPNARALNGFTPLHIACKKNHIKIVELLLKQGASLSSTTESGLAPLHVAAFMGCTNVLIYLLQHGAEPDAVTVRGETPLYLATRTHQLDVVRILLQNGSQANCKARDGRTPLHVATSIGNFDIAILLLHHGADVDAKTKDLCTPLHIAAKEGQTRIANLLIENLADLNVHTNKALTPLHIASKYGNSSITNILIEKKANLNVSNNNGLTPLQVAAHYNRIKIVQMLLENNADPNIKAKNGHTALHIAAKKNLTNIAAYLLQFNANPNCKSNSGFTPLHIAAQEGNYEMCQLLIQNGAIGNCQANNGLTPIHLCTESNQVECAKLFLNEEQCREGLVNINEPTKSGYTPLHSAAHFGHIEMVKFLLENNAKIEVTTNNGYTPLHQAAQEGHIKVIYILLSYNANPNSLNYIDETPVDVAIKMGHVEVVDILAPATERKYDQIKIDSIPAIKLPKENIPEKVHEMFISDCEDEEYCVDDQINHNQYIKYISNDHGSKNDFIASDMQTGIKNHNDIDSCVAIIENFQDGDYQQQKKLLVTKSNAIVNNVNIIQQPAINVGFLISFLVDARGGAMRGCRHSGVHIIVPAGACTQPTRITCRYVKPTRITSPPPVMEGEALVSRILELSPAEAKFLRHVVLEIPHFGSLRNKEREFVILRSDNGQIWREHSNSVHNFTNKNEIVPVIHKVSTAKQTSQDKINEQRIIQISTREFPHFFAIVSRVRQEVYEIGPDGATITAQAIPQVQVIFPPNALTKKIRVGLQAQPIDLFRCAKFFDHNLAASPVVTVEPRRRKFHKAITLSIPAPRSLDQEKDNNQYSSNTGNSTTTNTTVRLLCSITGGQNNAVWEDVTGSTLLQFINQKVQFTTTVSARFWLIDCKNTQDPTRLATELYQKYMRRVPFCVKFVVYAKRISLEECSLSVYCMTDDKENKTLENQDNYTEVAKSDDCEILEGQKVFLDVNTGNITPIVKPTAQTSTNCGGHYQEKLNLEFHAFQENRLCFFCHILDYEEPTAILQFSNDPKYKMKSESDIDQSICQLRIDLSSLKIHTNKTLKSPIQESFSNLNECTDLNYITKKLSEINGEIFTTSDNKGNIHKANIQLLHISKMIGNDWKILANELEIPENDIDLIRSEYPNNSEHQSLVMLKLWLKMGKQKRNGSLLERALIRIGRKDIIEESILNSELVTDHLEKSMAEQELKETEETFNYFKDKAEVVVDEFNEITNSNFTETNNYLDYSGETDQEKENDVIEDNTVASKKNDEINEIIENSINLITKSESLENMPHPNLVTPLGLIEENKMISDNLPNEIIVQIENTNSLN